MEQTRRQALAGVAVAGSTALAGCSELSPGFGFGGGTDQQIMLRTLEVGGSDGSTVPHRPPGDPALLDFFASWCPPCRPQMAELRTVNDQFPELHILSISWEENTAAIRQFWREHDGAWPVAQDTALEAADAYGVTRLPTKILLDADGEQRWEHTGLADADTIAEEVADVIR